MTNEKAHWSDRIRRSKQQALELAAECGPTIGMTGAAVAGGAAAAAMMQALAASGATEVAMLRESAATFIMTGCASAVAGGLLGKYGKAALGEEEYERMRYGDRWEAQVASTVNAPKGAVPVIDDPTRGPMFQEAMREAMAKIDKDPQAKKQMVELLSRSPEARQSLIDDVFKNIDQDSGNHDAGLRLLKESNDLGRSDIDSSPGTPSLG